MQTKSFVLHFEGANNTGQGTKARTIHYVSNVKPSFTILPTSRKRHALKRGAMI